MALTPLEKRIIVLVALVVLTGTMLFPIFLITYGIMDLIEDSGTKSTSKFDEYKHSFGMMLLFGSIVGIIIAVFLPNRAISLLVGVVLNLIIAIAMRSKINSMNTIVILFLLFGGAAGIMGPVLVLFITDQYITKEQVLNDAFIYMIGCCSLVISSYRLYKKNLYNDAKGMFNVAIGCFVVALVVCLSIIAVYIFLSKRCFILRRKLKNRRLFKRISTPVVIRLILRNLLASLLFIFVTQLEISVDTWTVDKFGFNITVNNSDFNQTEVRGINQTRVNASERFPEGSVIVLVPAFIFFGLEAHPVSYFMVACFSILLAAWLWPYLQKCCIPVEYRLQLIQNYPVSNETATIETYPNLCDVDLPIANAMYCLITFGKFMLVSAVLLISCRNFETNQIFLAVTVCFCFVYIAHLTAITLSKNYLKNVNKMMSILFIIMLLNIYLNIYVADKRAKRVPDEYDDSEMEEVKVVKSPRALKLKNKPEPEPSKEQPTPLNEEPPKPKQGRSMSISVKRSSRTDVDDKSRRGKKK